MNADQQKQKTETAKAITPISHLPPSRLPITSELAAQLNVSPGEWRVLVDQTFPAARTVEAIALAISYCRSRNLDIMKKPVHIVPMYSAALKRMVETVWPGIAEIRTTATRTKAYAGIDDAEFGPTVEREFIQIGQREDRSTFEIKRLVNYPQWCRIVVYRLVGGQRCAFSARVFWEETYATANRETDLPNEMWRKRPFGQIDKCAEAAALRKAFPEELGGEYAAEEMAGRELAEDSVAAFAVLPEPAPAPRPPRQKAEAKPKTDEAPTTQQQPPPSGEGDIIDGDIIDDPADGDGGFQFFDRLREALSVAQDKETLQEIWNDFDPLARFQSNQHAQDTCQSILKFQERRVANLTKGESQ